MKSSVFEAARWLCALLILVLLIVTVGTDTVSTADAADVAAAVAAQIDMSEMLEADNQMIRRLYGLDPSEYESVILYYPNTNMMAEELLVVKLADTSQQDTVRAAAEQRLQTQKNTFEGYGVEQYAMLSDNAVIEVRGNFVLFLVNAESAAGRKAFLNAL